MKYFLIVFALFALAGCNDNDHKPLKNRVAELEANVSLLTGAVDDLMLAQAEPVCSEYAINGARLYDANGPTRYSITSVRYERGSSTTSAHLTAWDAEFGYNPTWAVFLLPRQAEPYTLEELTFGTFLKACL